ncbi:peptidase S8 and S53 subtilisin kexin sedolisin [Apostichopus japonicus]|uniref:Peptidase S8 and S53 subtilisin kexin sedolisin n=1 Tax=Stichopus japonicus TaxID=307972 RepID=A0A2G8K294_STIJA|nr:peptidase S8 and S53 subtilisin kexin sedolisin [Apostichopus japonicus]
MREFIVFVVSFAFISVCIGLALSEEMAASAGDPIEGSYIVKVKDGFSSENVITSLSGKFSCVKITRRYSAALNGFAAELPKEAVAFLEGMDAVEYVEQDQVMSIQPIGIP